jgi:hypothetical protein
MTISAERRYRIIVAGESVRTLVDVIERIEVESCGADWMRFVVPVRDESEFYGLLDRFQDLVLHIVSVEELSGASMPHGPIQKPEDAA